MAITIKFEDPQLEHSLVAASISDVVREANSLTDDIHAALDYVRAHCSNFGLWAYRGGYHVGLHFLEADGHPHHDRAALIS